jgi:hypothetical protein
MIIAELTVRREESVPKHRRCRERELFQTYTQILLEAAANCTSEREHRALRGGHEGCSGAEGLQPANNESNGVPITVVKIPSVEITVLSNEVVNDFSMINCPA